MGCEGLTFFTPADATRVSSVILKEGLKWHQYGDARWPAKSAWIEIDTAPGGFPGTTGILTLRVDIPERERDPLEWASRNGPLHQLFPDARSDAAVSQWLGMMKQRAAVVDDEPAPADEMPQFVQSYCLYRGPGDVRLLARYTDLLNASGLVIPRYRTATANPSTFELCRFSLHALFRLNEARQSGMELSATRQLDDLEPVYLIDGERPPQWTRFHPMRTLRTRTAVRALPLPHALINGIMTQETMEKILEVRRREVNLHNLAFTLDARRRVPIVNDANETVVALLHRANGGAIYSLPDQLVEEFDNTDCDEVRLSDLRLPFANLYLKFTPPTPLVLGDGALVDGCYVVKQGDEYLFSLTSLWTDVAYDRSLSVTCLDPYFSLHLPVPPDDPALGLNEAVERGIDAFFDDNEPPDDDQSQTITRPDGTTMFVEDVRAKSRLRRIDEFERQEPVFRACLNIIVNAICFISFRPDDITDEWDIEPPGWVTDALKDTRDTRSARDRRQQALRLLSTSNFTRIKVCGKNLFSVERHYTDAATGKGVSPRAHWRRGHWRRQRHGPGLTLVKPMWIRPTVVMKDNGPVVEARIYDVSSDQAPPPT